MIYDPGDVLILPRCRDGPAEIIKGNITQLHGSVRPHSSHASATPHAFYFHVNSRVAAPFATAAARVVKRPATRFEARAGHSGR